MADKIGENIKKLKDIFPNYIAEKLGRSLEEIEKNAYSKLFVTLTEIPEMLLKGALETAPNNALQELAN